MTILNRETGELTEVTVEQVRASVRRVIDHAESIWDEWAWQVENRTWTVLGYESWDEMRRGEYGALTSVTAPRAERPELTARFRGAGLTQKQTADTLGVNVKTVKRDEHPEWKGTNVPPAEEVIDAEIVEDDGMVCEIHHPDDSACSWDCLGRPAVREVRRDPADRGGKTYEQQEVRPQRRSPLLDSFFRSLHETRKKVESLHRLVEDDRVEDSRARRAGRVLAVTDPAEAS